MFRKFLIVFFIIVIPFFIFDASFKQANCWGFYAHSKINKMAVYTLPSPLIGFYKKNIYYITTHAVDADKRRYVDEEEAPKHYLDIDCYPALDSIPYKLEVAYKKYGEDSVKTHGILPWQIKKSLYSLTKAFEKEDVSAILKLSADIGHYIADAHVPLHTTSNYNGQKTNQHGIHAFWESRVPELTANTYDYWVGKSEYIDNVDKKIWGILKKSSSLVDSVLVVEKNLTGKYDSDKKYAFETKGNTTIKVYSKDFSMEYHHLLNKMVEERMRESIMSIGSFWYTAWVNAGKPDMVKLKSKTIPDSLKVQDSILNQRWKLMKKYKPWIEHEE